MALGFFERGELQPEDIGILSGLELTTAMPDESLVHFNDKRLDWSAGCFTLNDRHSN
jgi:hypothetical protein